LESTDILVRARPGTTAMREPSPPPAGIDLSVVIPARDEAKRLPRTLEAVASYLKARGLPAEILVVDDGSADATAEVAERSRGITLVRLPGREGKGAAVRAGVLRALGRRVLFTDADLSTPIGELDRLSAALDGGADVAIASRHLPGSRVELEQPFPRRHLGRLFNRAISLLGVRGFADTQCGFKLFRAEAARAAFGPLRTRGLAFDVEVLLRCRRLGFRIAEVPVRWANSSGSRVRPLRDSVRMLLDVLRMRGLR
jgi:dolichyl-phosphate beta-glucosyltransferase